LGAREGPTDLISLRAETSAHVGSIPQRGRVINMQAKSKGKIFVIQGKGRISKKSGVYILKMRLFIDYNLAVYEHISS
jgi:hypothetical protein